MNLFDFFKPKSYLGVDIGTSAIKVVQLAKARDTYKLENYGQVSFFSETEFLPMEVYEQNALKMPDEQVVGLLKKIIVESGITAKQVAISLPVFSAFSTIIELPPMPKDEMEKAIQFEARQYIPIPVSEVSIASMIIGEERPNKQADRGSPLAAGPNVSLSRAPRSALQAGKKHLEILLVAVPNEIKKKYQNIAKATGLELIAIEMETFPMARALLKGSRDVIAVVDVGARSTDICISDNGVVRISHNFESSGIDITKAFGSFSRLDLVAAEKEKRLVGLNLTPGQLIEAGEILVVIDGIISETSRIISSYFNRTGRSVSAVVLSGGSAVLPGLMERFKENLSIAVSIGDPFQGLIYPPELKESLASIGPSFAVAVGLAMRK